MPNALPLSALKNAGRQPALPLVLALPGEGDTLRLERLLRVLPNRRYVGVALWRDAQGQAQTVLAKLLVGPTAARHFEREKTGAALLAEQGLTTPRLLAAGFAVPVGGWLLSEYLADAQSLGERWQALEDAPSGSDAKAAQARILDEALAAIAQLHAKGLWQADLHLDNLLYQQGRLFLIDGGGIRAATPGQPLPKALALENLGVFFAQLPLRLEAELVHWLNVYLVAQPDSRLSLADRPALHKAIARQRRLRLNDLLKKIGRDCTLFKVKKTGPFGLFGFCAVRREAEPLLAPLLENPDAFIAQGQLYKAGGTATVAKGEIAGRAFILKRYNIKHFWHGLTRCWRPSRAWVSWREGHRLMTFGIATAKPLAVIERRWLGLRRTAYLVSEYLDGPNLLRHFQNCLSSSPPPDPAALKTLFAAELAAAKELFARLRQAQISHGDLKGHNLIWQAKSEDGGRWALIDLDAMQAHTCSARFARAHARDCARFLKNWPVGSVLRQLLEAQIQERPPSS